MDFTKDGRKLRPRRAAAGSAATSERVEYHTRERRESDRENGDNDYRPRRSFGGRPEGERKPYGERRSSGEDRPRRSFGERPEGERKPYGERRSFGERRGFGEGRPDGERRGFGEGRSEGEHRPYGEHRSSGEDRPRRSFGGRPDGERKPYGERRSFGERPGGERKPYGERRSFGERRGFGEGRPEGEHRPYGENRGLGEDRPRRSFGPGTDGERKPYGERRSFGGRKPSFGGARPARKNVPMFNKESDEGIERMISRKPQLEGREMSDFDSAPSPISEEVRLNKFIANSGVCSRREADTLIQAGVVTVNGEVVTELGTKVNVFTDEIKFNGETLKGEEKVYIVMNKPKGFVTTASDPHAEKTVLDLLKGCRSRVYPVGRLDKNTTGVLMFTNDGEISERLTHPSYNKKKIYQVILDHELRQEDYDAILAGVTLSDGDVAADELEFIDENDHRKLGIEIHSGKNRIVRRIFESLGYDVRALDRVYFAGLTKKGLKKGEWRYLSEGEVNILKMGAYI